MWTPDLQVFDHAATEHQHIAGRDLFALGCYLAAIGKGGAGARARWSALESIGVPLNAIHEVVNDIQTDRTWIAAYVAPHSEILDLFEELP